MNFSMIPAPKRTNVFGGDAAAYRKEQLAAAPRTETIQFEG